MTKKKKVKNKKSSKPKSRGSIKKLQESRDGGQIALRGYSYQFLYSCYLILSATEENTTFNLEGVEDIDHIICKNGKQCITHIQLKYSAVRQNANFMVSVLKNFLEAYLLDDDRNFKLVYDFSVATGHLSKLLNGNLDGSSRKHWKEVIEKIKKGTDCWDWEKYDFNDFISRISYESIKKSTLESRVEEALINNYNIDIDNITLFTNSIKIFCLNKMESRGKVSLKDIKKCIEEVKFDISKGPQNPAHSWIKRVDFLASSKEEFDYYEGKKATSLDIANGLPVSRPVIEKEIEDSVNNHMVTVIKSSSGQGKTTLAFKTQYALKEEYTPYQIVCCNDRKELGHIVEYFHLRIRVGEKPLILLDNLDANLSEWNQLVQLMQDDVSHNCKIIVTSRENDWYNYGGDVSNIHSMNIIKPTLLKEEAINVFNNLKKLGYVHFRIKNWESAWEKIADKKLLIEYVYLLTHGEMIAEHISAQMNEIGKTPMSGITLEILRKVCFADVCGIRLSTRKLLRELSKNISYDIGEILKSMTDEFLVHVSEDGDYIEGLHPVRSQHIVNRLHECYLLEDTAYDVTKLADIKDFSVLFSHYPEYDFDKEKFYLKVVNKWWDCENLSCFVLALQGTFSGSVMQYFKQNESSFNDANEHSGLDILAMDICPFTQFQEINESVQTLETMKDIMPDNKNVQYLINLKNSFPKINIRQTDIYILSLKLYNKLKDTDTENIPDMDSYAIIADWLCNIDFSLNLAVNINLKNLWERAELYSIETVSLLMYTAYCGNRKLYESFIEENLENILAYIKHKTFSHNLYVDETERTIHVEYILRVSEIKKANEESVSRLKYICRTLPIYEIYCSDAIMPQLEILEGYNIPDEAHKEMPRRNLIIMFHQDFTSLWIKTIKSNYEFDSVTEWIKHWFKVRKYICESLEEICVCIYKLLAGKDIGRSGAEFDRKREQLEKLLRGVLAYPKAYRPFEKNIEVPIGFTKVKKDYFDSIQNFLRQVVGLIRKEKDNSRLALINLKQAMNARYQMQNLFKNMALEKESYTKHLELCKVEDAKLFECDICGRYYLKHDADLHFNKYEVKEWYVNTCKKEINEVNSLLEPIQQEYGIIFPIRSYEEGIFKNYPIILKSFNFTDEEMIQEFMINAMFFAESSFDYLVVLFCDENNYVYPKALKVSKQFFVEIQEQFSSFEGSEEKFYVTPYPIDAPPDIRKCFACNIEMYPEDTNPYIHNIGDIGQELWVYSRIRQLLSSSEDKEYCDCELKKVMNEIDIMRKEIWNHVSVEMGEQMDKLCETIYAGEDFSDEKFNEFIQDIQKINSI